MRYFHGFLALELLFWSIEPVFHVATGKTCVGWQFYAWIWGDIDVWFRSHVFSIVCSTVAVLTWHKSCPPNVSWYQVTVQYTKSCCFNLNLIDTSLFTGWDSIYSHEQVAKHTCTWVTGLAVALSPGPYQTLCCFWRYRSVGDEKQGPGNEKRKTSTHHCTHQHICTK